MFTTNLLCSCQIFLLGLRVWGWVGGEINQFNIFFMGFECDLLLFEYLHDPS